MKTVKIPIYTVLAAALISVCGCERTADAPYAGEAVVFSTGIRGFDGADGTRASVNYDLEDYFAITGSKDYTEATVKSGEQTVTYKYASGELNAATTEDIIRFPLNGGALASLSITWPAGTDTQAGTAKDQSGKEAFFSSDVLEYANTNIMPAAKIPVVFTHKYAKVTFRLAGTLKGSKITGLVLDSGYTAFCDPDDANDKDAHLMLNPLSEDDKTAVAASAAGTASIEGADSRRFILNVVPETLAGGNNYVIKLNL